jgi:phosphoribosyl-AMP cyclohydrolase
MSWLDEVKWDDQGLVPAIAQDHATGQVLMMAWMNRESLQLTLQEGRVIYWSRSRGKLWRKGEESGNVQIVKEMRLDCDADVILLSVDQHGGVACHTGRPHCFYKRMHDSVWVTDVDVVIDPKDMYS